MHYKRFRADLNNDRVMHAEQVHAAPFGPHDVTRAVEHIRVTDQDIAGRVVIPSSIQRGPGPDIVPRKAGTHHRARQSEALIGW